MKINHPKEDFLSRTINWNLFAAESIISLSPEEWPLRTPKDMQSSALYLVSRTVLTPVKKRTENIRRLILDVEKNDFTGIRFYFAENRDDSTKNLIYASMLADGFLDNSTNKFQLAQSATPLVRGGHSHLEYGLSLFLEFSDEILTACPLELRSGLPYEESSPTSNSSFYSWKIRLSLLILSLLKEFIKKLIRKVQLKDQKKKLS